MTERLYYISNDLELNTEVLSCMPETDGRFRIILASTLFHPQGGGQPSDRGMIGSARMLQAIQNGPEVIHFTDVAVEAGPVRIQIDGMLRHHHSRYHSAGHLIAYTGEKYGWYGYKGNHHPGEGRIAFRATRQNLPVTIDDFAEGVTDLVARDLVLRTFNENEKRMVTWGDLPAYACGGTHVQSTGQVGQIIITRIKERKGELSVQYELRD
ncbi:serine-tRNA(Ala) deacylase AlaX [Escherichia coli]|uniref:serine-tRNA(Ala) deacylase AlaX n=1 Tax=Escherichia coli TaxID=562 RepID=UPI0006A5A8ED|nr:serine-tRNA(Ala) deacylase AlaX [Escherichia coli]